MSPDLLYESHYVSHFFRLWGHEEGRRNMSMGAVLLGNAQNAFDSALGDVCGASDARFFLIEFKADRSGFAAEVAPSGKPHRHALYQHLLKDRACHELSHFCHFGGYYDKGLQGLAFEWYESCPRQRVPRSQIIIDALNGKYDGYRPIVPPNAPMSFTTFFDYMTHQDMELYPVAPTMYSHGLGVPAATFKTYVKCMYQHLVTGTDRRGAAVLGVYAPKSGKFVSFGGTASELVTELHSFFSRAEKQLTPSPPSPRAQADE